MVAIFSKFPWLKEPHPLIARNREAFENFDQSQPLNDYTFVVCDTELTGLDRRRDEIVSIGAVMIRNLQIDLSSSFHSYIRPDNLEHTRATLVHRITPGQLEEAPPLNVVLPAFVEFLGSSLLVGHHIALDMTFLNRASKKVLGGTLVNPGIDTMRMAQGYRRVLLGHYHQHGESQTGYSLDALSREYRLPLFKPHDALEDAMQTAYLFLFLLKKFRKGGLLTLKDIYQAGRVGSLRY
ncbi:MAG: 3'-5' exonuclease [Desulfobulbaceae bacterium]|uniref:3'-5' exonuclease n=1 Tax=Candidatus Desulfatifera sulfidica TaxID=2841691 RepID=A0A8J6N8Z4_9BACT|nr:3'-5' exonuclease [Candidatus Desulfatifera sulfidica]